MLDSWGHIRHLEQLPHQLHACCCALGFSTRRSQAAPPLNPRAVPRASRAAPSRVTQAAAAASLSVRAARRQQSRRSASRSSSSTAADNPPALYRDAITLRRKKCGETFSGRTVCWTTRLAQRGGGTHPHTRTTAAGPAPAARDSCSPAAGPAPEPLPGRDCRRTLPLRIAGALGAPLSKQGA